MTGATDTLGTNSSKSSATFITGLYKLKRVGGDVPNTPHSSVGQREVLTGNTTGGAEIGQDFASTTTEESNK